MRNSRQRTDQVLTRRHALQGMLAASGLALVGCSSAIGSDPVDGQFLAWPAEDRWPPLFYEASENVQHLYRFAVANQDLLKWMPCFCGCVEQGHTSNFDCYVRELRGDGSVIIDTMSFG